MAYPKRLSQGENNTVVALSETEVGKLFNEDTRSDIGSEAEKLKLANLVNDLLVQFIRLDIEEESSAEILVMERLFPLDYRALDVEKQEAIFNVFTDQLEELHAAGLVHRNLKRPSGAGGDKYDNILLTYQGLRLIDAGTSALKHQVGEKLFEKFLEKEREELQEFKEYFLSR